MRRFLLTFFVVLLISFSSLFSQSQQTEIVDKMLTPNQELTTSIIPLKSSLPCNFFRNISSSFIGISDAGTIRQLHIIKLTLGHFLWWHYVRVWQEA